MIQKNQNTGEIVIDLRKLLIIYLRHWWQILLGGILAGLVLYGYTRFILTPMYRATVTVYVNNAKSTQEVSSISTATLSASQQLVNTYINIIQSERVLLRVLEELRRTPLDPEEADLLDIDALTTDNLREMLTATQIESTEIFSINIRHSNPEIASAIANVFARVSPSDIATVVEGSSAQIIDYARTPEKPYNLNYKRSVFLGAAVGMLSVAAFLTLRFLLDVRIKEEEDLTQLFSIPILGQIPSFEQAYVRKSAYERGASQRAASGTKSERKREPSVTSNQTDIVPDMTESEAVGAESSDFSETRTDSGNSTGYESGTSVLLEAEERESSQSQTELPEMA